MADFDAQELCAMRNSVAADIDRFGPMSMCMVRTGLLADLIDTRPGVSNDGEELRAALSPSADLDAEARALQMLQAEAGYEISRWDVADDCSVLAKAALRAMIDFAAAERQTEREASFQDRVQPWMMQCFGPAIAADRVERGDRLLEEVLELLQSGGYDRSRIPALVDYVWSRPAGEPAQEVGGVMVTLAAYCLAFGLDMHSAGEVELARISQPETVEKIRAKQAAKAATIPFSPLPQQTDITAAAPRPAYEWSEEDGPVLWWLWPIEQPPYVGTPLDLGFTVEVTVDLVASDGNASEAKTQMDVGGWPFGDEDDDCYHRVFWTPLPDERALDVAIRDHIRGGPDEWEAA